MVVSLRRNPLELGLFASLAATVVLVVFGSGATHRLVDIGTTGRWVALSVLTAFALALVRTRLPGARPRAHHWLALLLVYAALLSTAWSISRRLTLERTLSVLVLFVCAAAIGMWVGDSRSRAHGVFATIALTAGLVCIAGLVVALLDRRVGVQGATLGTPWRLRGIGQNPNTIPMLAVVALPATLALIVETRRLARAAAVVALVAGVVTISLSGSRGAWVAGTAAALVMAVAATRERRRRAAAVAAAVVVALVALAATRIAHDASPSTSTASIPTAVEAAGGSGVAPGNVLAAASLDNCVPEDELGRPLPGQVGPTVKRTLLGTSGRATAWRRALAEWTHRPTVGYGFGTENRAFFSCFYAFLGARPENSYIGMLLQLGVVGLALLVALGVALAVAARGIATDPRGRVVAAAGLATIVAGAVAGITQSYVYAVGNVATVSVWVIAFIAAARPRATGGVRGA